MRHDRWAPAPALEAHVEHYWCVRWDLRGLEPFVAETLPHPSVHLVAQDGAVRAYGVARGRFTTTLIGEGRALGVKFRPGGFYGFLGRPVSTLAGRSAALADVFGEDGQLLERTLLDANVDVVAARVDAFLLARRPAPDDTATLVGRIVAEVVDDRMLTRAEALAQRHEMSLRTLQRLFARYVGASPKWVIRRYRLHDAAARLAGGDVAAWSTLALDLGYCDQAHFINDFRAAVGRSPAEHARALHGGA